LKIADIAPWTSTVILFDRCPCDGGRQLGDVADLRREVFAIELTESVRSFIGAGDPPLT